MSYQPVNCGGPNKIRDNGHMSQAYSQALIDFEDHPCGCEFCSANVLLANLYKERLKDGVNPYTGAEI